MMHTELDLNPIHFYHWLLLQDQDRKLGEDDGRGNRCVTCPLATYIVEALPYSAVYVSYDWAKVAYTGPDPYLRNNLPDWASYFVHAYDEFGNDTVGQALKVMKHILNVHIEGIG